MPGLRRGDAKEIHGGSSSHPRGMMANKASIIASWDIMVFGNGQGKGAEQHSGRTVALRDPHEMC